MVEGLPIAEVAHVLGTMGKRGRPGTVLMRQLVDARTGDYTATESELEDLVVAVLTRYELPLPAAAARLGHDAHIGRVDFAYRSPPLVIEADGRPFHMTLTDADNDRWRTTELVAAGFPVIRVTWRDLTQDPQRFAIAVARALGVSLPTNHGRKRGS